MAIIDPIRHPAHYEVYPVQPIDIAVFLGHPLGRALELVLRAPYKGGAEDCDKALAYLVMLERAPQFGLSPFYYKECKNNLRRLCQFLATADGDALWRDIACWQQYFLHEMENYIFLSPCSSEENSKVISTMISYVRELRRVLGLRDTTGQIYEGLTGLPEREGE